jgi:hypothetical protein
LLAAKDRFLLSFTHRLLLRTRRYSHREEGEHGHHRKQRYKGVPGLRSPRRD